MILRPAQAADAEAVAALWNPVIDGTAVTFTTTRKTPEGLAADFAARGPAFLLAEEEGRLLGFATFFAFRSGPGYARTLEHTVLLAPEAQGRGVGRALMTQPKLLMLDEPTAGVSPIVMDELFDKIVEIARTGIAILMVEQNARQALEIADHGFVLVQGTNRFTDTGEALLANEEVRRSFLGG